MTVRDVLEYLAGGMTHVEILDDFLDLTEDDIRACLAYDSAISEPALAVDLNRPEKDSAWENLQSE